MKTFVDNPEEEGRGVREGFSPVRWQAIGHPFQPLAGLACLGLLLGFLHAAPAFLAVRLGCSQTAAQGCPPPPHSSCLAGRQIHVSYQEICSADAEALSQRPYSFTKHIVQSFDTCHSCRTAIFVPAGPLKAVKITSRALLLTISTCMESSESRFVLQLRGAVQVIPAIVIKGP